MKITHLGHACLLVEAADCRILFDPGTFSQDWRRLQDLTAVVITHAHADHMDIGGLAELLSGQTGDVRVLAEPEAVDVLQEESIRAETVQAGNTVQLGSVELKGVGGKHACIHEDLGVSGNVGVVLKVDGAKLFHPGDDITTIPEGVDILALPLSAPWGSLKETVQFLRAVRPSRVVPIHDALLSGQGRKIFLQRIAALGLSNTEFVEVARGQPITI